MPRGNVWDMSLVPCGRNIVSTLGCRKSGVYMTGHHPYSTPSCCTHTHDIPSCSPQTWSLSDPNAYFSAAVTIEDTPTLPSLSLVMIRVRQDVQQASRYHTKIIACFLGTIRGYIGSRLYITREKTFASFGLPTSKANICTKTHCSFLEPELGNSCRI